jgi:hypothetical protein
MDGGSGSGLGAMTTMDMARSEAMMEGTRLLMESLREKVAALEQKCEQLDREKVSDIDLNFFRVKPKCRIPIGISVICFHSKKDVNNQRA